MADLLCLPWVGSLSPLPFPVQKPPLTPLTPPPQPPADDLPGELGKGGPSWPGNILLTVYQVIPTFSLQNLEGGWGVEYKNWGRGKGIRGISKEGFLFVVGAFRELNSSIVDLEESLNPE